MVANLRRHLRQYGAWWIAGLLTILYLFLQWNRYFAIPTVISPYDDGLQYSLSKSIFEGHWLGQYSSITLSKGLTFPLWTAALHTHNIALWLGNDILYLVASVAIVYAVSKLLRKRWLLLILYGLLLFNPIILVRSYRDTIAPALILLVLAWAIGMYALLTGAQKKTWADSVLFTLLGVVSLPAWMNLREDSFWLIPIVFLLITLGALSYLRRVQWRVPRTAAISVGTTLFLLLLPVLSLKLVDMKISSKNNTYYKRAVVNDFISADFKNAYAALTRIDGRGKKPLAVPVSRDMRDKLYREVPLFQKLQPCLDGPNGVCKNFEKYGPDAAVIRDYQGGWFQWALRLAAQNAGYYKDAATAASYYTQLAGEINRACENKNLSCHPPRTVNLTPLPTSEAVKPFVLNFKDSLLFVALLRRDEGYDDGAYYVYSYYTHPQAEQLAIAQYYGVRYPGGTPGKLSKLRLEVLKDSAQLYVIAHVILLGLALCALLYATVGTYKSKLPARNTKIVIVAWLVLAAIIFRAALLAYIQTVSFPAITVYYFSSIYVLMFIFEVLCISLLCTYLTTISTRSVQHPPNRR